MALVQAMNMIIKLAMPPVLPRRVIAVVGSVKPAATSSGSKRFGYVGKAGFVSRAIAPSPIVVPVRNGTANQANPPSI